MQNIVIIGGGVAGMATAIKLANAGYNITLIEKNTLGSGASGNNPGRMGHGFHYVDKETALTYLHASIKVQKMYPDFLVGRKLPFEHPVRHGRYFITKNSSVDRDEILDTYRTIQKEYARLVLEDPSNEVFGPPETFIYIIPQDEYEKDVNIDLVDTGIETCEHLFDWTAFQNHMRKKIESHPNITLLEHTRVDRINRNTYPMKRFEICTSTPEGKQSSFRADYIINSTWSEIELINDGLGITMVPEQRTNRLKALLEVELPPALHNKNSMFFCMGPHCMMTNLGNGRAMMTYAEETNLETSSGLSISKRARRLIDGKGTKKELDEIARKILNGVSQYIPAMKDAEIIGLRFGIVQTKGKLSLSDLNNPNHEFNKRNDHNVRTEQIGLISNPCMKLFYFEGNAELNLELIKKHIIASDILRDCHSMILTKLYKKDIDISLRLHRVILENLERYETESITENDKKKIIKTVVNTMIAKQSTLSFFGSKQSTSTSEESSCIQYIPN